MKPKLASKARLKLDRHSGAYMLLYPERGLSLNESAAEIVKRCDGTRTLDQIIDELAAAAGIERETIARDVVELVQQLERKGLITR